MKIAETSLVGLKPVSLYQTRVEEFYEVLKERFQDGLNLLAEPKKVGKDRVSWHSPFEGEAISYTRLPEEEQKRVRELLREQLTPIFTNTYTYKTPGLKELLTQMLQIPNYDSIYYIRGADRVVLVNWGFVEDRYNAPRDLLSKIIEIKFPENEEEQGKNKVEIDTNSILKVLITKGEKPLPNTKVFLKQDNIVLSELRTDANGVVVWNGKPGKIDIEVPEHGMTTTLQLDAGEEKKVEVFIPNKKWRYLKWLAFIIILLLLGFLGIKLYSPKGNSQIPPIAKSNHKVKILIVDIQSKTSIPGKVQFMDKNGTILGEAQIPKGGTEVELPPHTFKLEAIARGYVNQQEKLDTNSTQIEIPLTRFKQANSTHKVIKRGNRFHLGTIPYQETKEAYQFKTPHPVMVKEIQLEEYDGDYEPGSNMRVLIIGVKPGGKQVLLKEIIPSGDEEDKNHTIKLNPPMELEGVIIEPVKDGRFDELGGKWEIKGIDFITQTSR
jgi:hypothetical protein